MRGCMFSFPPPVTLKWTAFDGTCSSTNIDPQLGCKRSNGIVPKLGSLGLSTEKDAESFTYSAKQRSHLRTRRIHQRTPYAMLTFHFKYNQPSTASVKLIKSNRKNFLKPNNLETEYVPHLNSVQIDHERVEEKTHVGPKCTSFYCSRPNSECTCQCISYNEAAHSLLELGH